MHAALDEGPAVHTPICEAALPLYHFHVLVQGSGFRVQGSGFRVQGSGFRVQGSAQATDLEN